VCARHASPVFEGVHMELELKEPLRSGLHGPEARLKDRRSVGVISRQQARGDRVRARGTNDNTGPGVHLVDEEQSVCKARSCKAA
jgi:hypothetical protein